MSTIRIITAAMLVSGVLVTNRAALAQQAVNCDWYANTALQQQKMNVDRKCGFKGESWHFDRAAHMEWCRSASPEQWRRQAQFREQELSKCQQKR
jgi:hypothetical protein